MPCWFSFLFYGFGEKAASVLPEGTGFFTEATFFEVIVQGCAVYDIHTSPFKQSTEKHALLLLIEGCWLFHSYFTFTPST